MKPLTEAMQEALLDGEAKIVTGRYGTINGLRTRGLCTHSWAVGGSGERSAQLTLDGLAYQRRLRVELGAEMLQTFKAWRRDRIGNLPELRVGQARDDAIEAAVIVKGEGLTALEIKMVIEAVERTIDAFQADTKRVFVCPHGDNIVGQDGDKKYVDCPVHGDPRREGWVKVAVVFKPRRH